MKMSTKICCYALNVFFFILELGKNVSPETILSFVLAHEKKTSCPFTSLN